VVQVQHASNHLSVHAFDLVPLEPKHEINLSIHGGDQVASLVASPTTQECSPSCHIANTHTHNAQMRMFVCTCAEITLFDFLSNEE